MNGVGSRSAPATPFRRQKEALERWWLAFSLIPAEVALVLLLGEASAAGTVIGRC